ncbi:ornithine cyclodeaminase [Phaeobacter gallaeciensis]|uniref:Ornithine cyclodeaminase n=2 Tax=Phaeobacter gallaeciensis TaxID=60890 RepID=A0AAC9Z945_9RHOB|nr:ornithine cyclodeaminase [Phaeobacter gallaeciensis DSM 26640]ATE92132.1 ornithine cyclodeaminase [Phaeobacter gallaeciensis]ATE98049.1 ornithine cyclodeaminase [Phaeobacter gallaeciensis]ATF00743.1 ornithine cyclodeaminase [Phaeobacter gallaeciensis]ATF05174.1 ornithine cyclodeaminase [Phaeobacter gallaeciensis]
MKVPAMELKFSEQAYVPFVSVENMIRLVKKIGARRFMAELADVIEADFKRWELFDKTPRVASHSDVGVIELMPTSDGETYGFKYVNGHPKNANEGLQTVTAFGLLARVDTGYPILLTEMTLLTGLRTAAMSGLVGRHLAPKGADTMAMIGNGAQSEFQCLAFAEICGIKNVRLYDIAPEATRKCAKNLSQAGINVVTCTTPEESMEGAQVITTCTADKRNATILTGNMVGDGVHINAIGGDCPGKTEIAVDVIKRSDVFVEFPPQTRVEGDIQQLPEDYPVNELWQVMRGDIPGRTSDGQITMFDSVGFAVEDFSALNYVLAKIKGTDFFDSLDMLADPTDPRNLYGMLLD